jgi:hypothetical protein
MQKCCSPCGHPKSSDGENVEEAPDLSPFCQFPTRPIEQPHRCRREQAWLSVEAQAKPHVIRQNRTHWRGASALLAWQTSWVGRGAVRLVCRQCEV